jgi:UDP-hydrolysing UDP-N-acetyl-D-glucosamine 2-epimerase
MLFVGGMHLDPRFGLTVKDIEADGFPTAERIAFLLPSDMPAAIAESLGRGIIGFSKAYERSRPDILMVLGDRFEMFAATAAALPFKIPIAHIHGGELTYGAIDDAMRHAITKMAHLHFVATQEYAHRVQQLGEEPWRVTVSGAPALDNLSSERLLSRDELEHLLKLDLSRPPLLVTYHPVTLEYEQTSWQVTELLAALDELAMPVLFTMPNADTAHSVIVAGVRQYVKSHPDSCLVESLGTRAYFSLMRVTAAMVGNSSSGIVEAPSFALPVVNIGTRQLGRIRAANVIDVDYPKENIIQGVGKALSPDFKARLKGMVNPYGDGHAAERIVHRLKTQELNQALLAKRFLDVPVQSLAEFWAR